MSISIRPTCGVRIQTKQHRPDSSVTRAGDHVELLPPSLRILVLATGHNNPTDFVGLVVTSIITLVHVVEWHGEHREYQGTANIVRMGVVPAVSCCTHSML